MATAGLAFKSCTAKVFNKLLKNKNAINDNTLYFVTPDTEAFANTYDMQTVTLYRGANIVEDSNVIFVRDQNMPTYLDTAADTIYYRHHCMESHAQSLTSAITGTPGQKLYILFIDSIETSPTYNQIIDAFLYIWQSDIAIATPIEFVCTLDRALYTSYTLFESGCAIDTTTEHSNNIQFGLPFTYTISGLKKSFDSNSIEFSTIYLADTSRGTSISSADGFGKTSETYIKLKTSYLTIASDIKTLYDNQQEIVVLADAATGTFVNICEVTDYTLDLTGSWNINRVSIEAENNTCRLEVSTYSRPDTVFVALSDTPEDILEALAEGQLISFIKTNQADKFICSLFTTSDINSTEVISRDHDILTSHEANGCWLGFCIKNDTTDLFQLVDTLYKSNRDTVELIENVQSDVIDLKSVYKESSIEYPNGTKIVSTSDNNGTFNISGHVVINESSELKDAQNNYIIGDTPASLVVIGEEGVDRREENTLLGVKSAIIGADTDTMSDFTMHGIKKYLDYTADTLSQAIFIDSPSEEDDIAAINAKIAELEIEPVVSNIAVVRRPIATDTLDTSQVEDDITRYSYTGYVYVATTSVIGTPQYIWQAMAGNYSAKDIYFTQDFKFTSPVGVVTQSDIDTNNGYVARRATGRNLQDFMYDLFAQSKRPAVVAPTYSLSASATTSGDNEVGTYIIALNWDGTFTSGSYQYGSVNVSDRNVRNMDTDTGITATYEVYNNITSDKSTLLDSETGSGSRFNLGSSKIQIDTVGSKVYATVTGKCTAIDSPRIPVNNLHDPIDELRITFKPSEPFKVIANVSVSGHRKMFYGSSTSVLEINSNNIRTKLQRNAVGDTNSINVPVIEGASHIVIALPAGRKLVTLVNPDSKLDLTKVDGAITTTSEVIEGANGFGAEGTVNAMTYTIYEYKPRAALSANTYTATIANV